MKSQGKPLVISGTGCCLVDQIYSALDFSSASFGPYLSRSTSDGGLKPGNLVFSEDFEAYTGENYRTAIANLTNKKEPDMLNVGGPAIVSLVHAAQLLANSNTKVGFYGTSGSDDAGNFLREQLDRTPVCTRHLEKSSGSTPVTIVLSDPGRGEKQGDRIFINSIGSANDYLPQMIDNDFFNSDIVLFGGTALVPKIHSELSGLLKKSKEEGCITLVNTVFDFKSEKEKPNESWTLGKDNESYPNIDILITDREEALRLSGKPVISQAIEWFSRQLVSTVVITDGANDITAYSDGRLFGQVDPFNMPVSVEIAEQIRKAELIDTTGCGDNFVGGFLASLAWQLQRDKAPPDLKEACSWAVVSGGFCCLYLGGTLIENKQGEKLEYLSPYLDDYIKNLHG